MRKFFSFSALAAILLLGSTVGYAKVEKAEESAKVEKAEESAKVEKSAESAKVEKAAETEETVAPPEDLQEAAQLVSVAIDLAKTGKWLALALLLIQLLVFVIKKLAPKAFMKKWGSVTVAGLSASAAVVASVMGGASWLEASVIFAAGPASSLLVDLGHAAGILKHTGENAPKDADDEEIAAGEVAPKEDA